MNNTILCLNNNPITSSLLNCSPTVFAVITEIEIGKKTDKIPTINVIEYPLIFENISYDSLSYIWKITTVKTATKQYPPRSK